MSTPVVAQLVHTIPGRARLRVPERVGEESFFLELARGITDLGAVREVRASARTASLLIRYDGELETLLAHIRARGLSIHAPPRQRAPMRRLQTAIEQADAQMWRATDGVLSLGTLSFLGMLGAGIYQTRQGYFLPTGMALFKYALQTMAREAEREVSLDRPVAPSSHDGTPGQASGLR